MRTREPILTRGRDVWDGINLPVAEFEDRAARVREKMAAEGVDVLLCYGVGDRDGDIAYVSNQVHKVPGFPLSLVLTPETAIVLNQRSSRTRPIVERSTWIADVRFTRDLWGTFADILDEVAAPGADVAFVGADGMAVPEYESIDALRDDWALEVRDGFLEDLRAAKSERERDQVRRSGAILKELLASLEADATAPVREDDLEADLDRLARLHGAQDVRILVANPARSEGVHRPPESFPVREGDPLSVYLAARFEGYWSSASRTLTLGDGGPPAAVERAAGAFEAAVDAIEPGGHTDDVVAAVEGAGVLDERYPLVTGIGVELDEAPTLPTAEGEGFAFAPGHCLEVNLPVRTDDAGTVLFGDTVIVTEDGAGTATR